MERRINKIIDDYISQFKDSIIDIIKQQQLLQPSLPNNNNHDPTNDPLYILAQHVFDYKRLSINDFDFIKNKRTKHTIHLSERCSAKRANGLQCTRRIKNDTQPFCGTHIKATPHGLFIHNNNNNNNLPNNNLLSSNNDLPFNNEPSNNNELSYNNNEPSYYNNDTKRKIDIWIHDINGIIFYIDKHHNVYLPEDILSLSNKPRVIAKYSIDDNGQYHVHYIWRGGNEGRNWGTDRGTEWGGRDWDRQGDVISGFRVWPKNKKKA